MCSTPDERLTRLRAAIDALAAQGAAAGDPVAPAGPGDPSANTSAPAAAIFGWPAGAGREPGTADGTGESLAAGPAQAEDIDTRLARLWQMLAELDPELARRLPNYLA